VKGSFRCIVDAAIPQTQEINPLTYPREKTLSFDRVVGSIVIAAIFSAISGSTVVFIVVAGMLLANSFVHSKPRPPRVCRR